MEVDFLGAMVTCPEAPEVDVKCPFPELLKVEIYLAWLVLCGIYLWVRFLLKFWLEL